MSEFSESYHLVSGKQEEGAALLRKAGLSGYVFPARNNWVTLLPSGGIFEYNEDLIAKNGGILLHYVYAEDHGWSFTLYERTSQIAHYSCYWEEEIVHDRSELNLDAMMGLLNGTVERDKPIETGDLNHLFACEDFEELFEMTPAYRLAERLGIVHYEWLSYESAERHEDELRGNPEYEGYVKVE
ncbi:hypothetical protein GZH47_13065 [Paenibacillus rhizovicinus]|uniref:Uncharacterized protein n=1 Tax=Paenibacillus rhizovicinus TaxID=2704463 RepID=A0A6C0NZI8_9BACL|nr:hypothetical protein [Paenibacillus rhizovicinus]QHW31680.1 hypothetical protein GZH47_13065 [Paenibacillus rhizovicinus]